MVKIKICGLSRLRDIDAVNEEGPDFIGFVFADSRRKITPEQALELRRHLRPGILPVGVFVNEEVDKIRSLVRNGIIDAIQLHGAETEEDVRKLRALTNKPVIKAIAVRNRDSVQEGAATEADYLLLDRQGGGTGRRFDWDLVGDVRKPFFLAGGLNADNVVEAVQTVDPFAVDVSGGVETDGWKDHAKIKEFVRRARNV
ncbi:MAG: phosphoribosylanthranilate isomerase [Polyangiaceae bacterium]|nr:phosphoribosylanthranilate isomerase [Polyangiaceae bacterium]